MKRRAIIFLIASTTFCVAQEIEQDTLFSYVPSPVLSVGVSGGVSFINPNAFNDQIEFNNSAFDTDEPPIRTPALFAVWVGFRPVNLPTYFSLRGEFMRSSRTFAYVARETNSSGGAGTTFSDKAISHYTLIPLSISTGTVIPKMLVRVEIGFIYAFAMLDDIVSMGSYGETKKTYNGDGYGFRLGLQQGMPLTAKFGVTMELSYRYLKLEEFRDDRGSSLQSLVANYSGVALLIGISYGF